MSDNEKNIDWDKVERAKQLMATVAADSDAVHEYCEDLNEEEREVIGCCCGGGRITSK